MLKSVRVAAIAGLAFLAAGCATTNPASLAENDPYEPTNRAIFDFNQKVDKAIAQPVARTYVRVAPPPLQTGVHNFLANLRLPVTFANDLFQGEFRRAGQTLGRFVINSTIGAGGIGDVATRVGIQEHTEDFGQTMAVYGVKEGPYLVLPILGPSNPRDAVGEVVDIAIDPLTYVSIRDKIFWNLGRTTLSVVDTRARSLDTLDSIERGSVDFYATVRSLYRQNRNSEISNGQTNLEDLPNF